MAKQRIINKCDISDIYDYIAYFEYKYGNLNFFMKTVFSGCFTLNELTELSYCYYKINNPLDDIDEEEYEARYGDRGIEFFMENLKLICKDIANAMNTEKYKPNYYGYSKN